MTQKGQEEKSVSSDSNTFKFDNELAIECGKNGDEQFKQFPDIYNANMKSKQNNSSYKRQNSSIMGYNNQNDQSLYSDRKYRRQSQSSLNQLRIKSLQSFYKQPQYTLDPNQYEPNPNLNSKAMMSPKGSKRHSQKGSRMQSQKNASRMNSGNDNQNVSLNFTKSNISKLVSEKDIQQDIAQFQVTKSTEFLRPNQEENKSYSMHQGSFLKNKSNIQSQELYRQYMDLLQSIKHLQQSTQSFLHQSHKLKQLQQDIQLEINCNQENYNLPENQNQSILSEINEINNAINTQNAIEKQYDRVINELYNQFNQISLNIKNMKFRRPKIIKDQFRCIIDDINALKTQFINLQRQTGSLDLVQPPKIPTSGLQTVETIEHFNQDIIDLCIDDEIVPRKQLDEYALKSLDAHFSYNIKVSFLKQQWNIFSNEQLQIRVNYANNCPQLTIGNKTSQLISNLSLEIMNKMHQHKSEQKVIMLNEYSYYVYNLAIEQKVLNKVKIEYSIRQTHKEIILFVPSGLFNYGQFVPLTQQQFYSEHHSLLYNDSVSYRLPFAFIDKLLINNIHQINQIFISNLLTPVEEDGLLVSGGLFMTHDNQGMLIKIKQKDNMISVQGHGDRADSAYIVATIHTLHYILTV